MNREQQLVDLDSAYNAFVQTLQELSPEDFLTSLGDWTPRDIAAHFIGWNDITLTGCREVCEGKEPFYFYDGTNDYRIINAGFFTRYASTDRTAFLDEMEATRIRLIDYLMKVDPEDWNRDTGVEHYRKGPATVARCVDSLIRDYQKHRLEIVQGFPDTFELK